MNSGHSRGDRRPDGDQPGGHPAGPSDYDAVYGRDAERDWLEPPEKKGTVGKGPDAVPAPSDSEWLNVPADDGAGPADFDVTGYRQQLLSGPGAELYGMGGGGFVDEDDESAAYAAFDERSLDAGPVSRPGYDSGPISRPSFDSGYFTPPPRETSTRRDLRPARDEMYDSYVRDPRDTGVSRGSWGARDGRQGGSGGSGDSDRFGDSDGFGRFDGFDSGPFRDPGGGPRDAMSLPGRAPSPFPRKAAPETPAETSGLVRPYFRTKGRTRPALDLALESLISTSDEGRRLDRIRVPEHRSICGLCLDTRSVAEVAALMKVPLGVARILVGDVAGLGLVFVHSTTAMVGDRPSIDFMERVLSGLRRI